MVNIKKTKEEFAIISNKMKESNEIAAELKELKAKQEEKLLDELTKLSPGSYIRVRMMNSEKGVIFSIRCDSLNTESLKLLMNLGDVEISIDKSDKASIILKVGP